MTAKLTDAQIEGLRKIVNRDDPHCRKRRDEQAATSGQRAPVDGATFILEAPEHVPAVWGNGADVAWPAGGPRLLVGPPGVGKTTLAQQITLARCGAKAALDLLGMTVEPDRRPVLYVAADRPQQAARSFRRMVSERDRHALADRLLIWRGPLPFNLVHDPSELATWVSSHGAGTVVIDSLKDIASPLSQDDVGSAVNLAHQHVIAAGIEVLSLHHQRKPSGENKKPTTLADVYGSTWITAGAGSVLLLWGQAGDPIVELSHLKQPSTDIGPLRVIHEHAAGRTSLHNPVDLYVMLQAATNGGLTVAEAARALYGTADPSRNEVEKARRRLQNEVARGHAVEVPGGAHAKDPTRFRPVERRAA